MNETVENFYEKNRDSDYREEYDDQHGPRINFVIEKCGLDKVKGKNIADFGCGLGNFFKRLDKSNRFVGFDGAQIKEQDKLCPFSDHRVDFDFQENFIILEREYDVSISSETIEHLSNPYNLLVNIKRATKIDGDIILTIPDVSVWHNTIYPALMFPHTNFEQFLAQMALPIQEYYFWEDGWKTHIWKCKNAPWEESKMMFPKNEPKFKGATPLEYTNL